jgi:hypothetical protein
LSPLAIKNESSHNENEFSSILKLEFTHLFVDHLVKGRAVLLWLNEETAQYIAKQYKSISNIRDIEDNFCKKMSTEAGWYKRIDYFAYPISALFVYFLVERYYFKKIKELLLLLDKKYNYPCFKKIFLNV